MMLDWFNARAAVACGHALADSFVSNDESVTTPRRGGRRGRRSKADVAALLRRAMREAEALNLNVFKRAKLVGAFKWRLADHGLEPAAVEEMTHLLMLELSGGRAMAANISDVPARMAGARRVPVLLAESDASFNQGDYVNAVARLSEVVRIEPNHALAHNKLGAVLVRSGRYARAEEEFRRAIELKPSLSDAYFNLGLLLFWRGDVAPSETALRQAVKLNSKNVEALISLGVTLGSMGRYGEGKRCFDQALRMKSTNPRALCGLGWLAGIGGRRAEAEQFYRDALRADSRSIAALAGLSDLGRVSADDEAWLSAVTQALGSPLTDVEESSLRFALGKHFDSCGRFAEAFAEYRRANELHKRVVRPYDRLARAQLADDLIRVYSAEQVVADAPGANYSEQPVFVVGMMRSGTSLVEQIVASHPQAYGAGELDFWHATALKNEAIVRREPPDEWSAQRFGDAYLEILERYSRGARRVVDKSTFNSNYLGLIHRVFPRSRMIYLRRDPVDTCLSCYFQNFVNAMSFTMDLDDLAHYYREHHRLMEHWRRALPRDVFLEVPYAELVADQESWSRRIIDFIGLEWDPKVLEFHKTERAVLTASNWQVREKMYSSSVGRWQNYRKFIGPLLKLRNLSA